MLLITIIVSFSEGHHERRRWVHIMWQCNKWWANRLVCLVVHNHLKPICMPNHRVQLHINLTLCLHTLQSNKKYEIRKLWNLKKKVCWQRFLLSAPVDPFTNFNVDALEKVLVTFIKDSFFRLSSQIIHR